jgi:uncharacterized protein (DUF2141 family)
MNRFLRSSAAAASLLLGTSAAAQPADCTGHEGPVRLYVEVEGIQASEGLIAVSLYADDSSKFLAKRGALYVGRVPARAPKTTVCIYLPSTGVYALGVSQDVDSDRKYDRTSVGLPDEPFGFSNDPAVFLGLPRFSSVRLSVPRDNMHTSVRLRHP